MTAQELEEAKYRWRIKYPKTYEMAVRNKFLDGERPPEGNQLEGVGPLVIIPINDQITRQTRQQDDSGSEENNAARLPVSRLNARRRGRRNRKTHLMRDAAQQSDIETRSRIDEIMERLAWLESVLSSVIDE